MKIIYFDLASGISGDMTLGALLDAGADFESLLAGLRSLALDEPYEVTRKRVVKGGIAATDLAVHTNHSHHHRGYSEIAGMIAASGLTESVKHRSTSIFQRLGKAEAAVHGCLLEDIHFHEVGAVDAIVDIVGACICLELLGVERVYASRVPTFHGTAQCAHGVLPLPAPAVIELLKGAPWMSLDIEGEIVTPTGAAIVAALSESFGGMPVMTVCSVGYGSGKKDFGIPNVLRVLVGEAGGGMSLDEISVIETNIDDMNPQLYASAMDALFIGGALDVYLTPIQMKKGRPAVLLTVLCNIGDEDRLSHIVLCHTSSIGVRISRRRRICLEREMASVETVYGMINVKLAKLDGEVVNAQPEFEECAAAAERFGVPVKTVIDAATVETRKLLLR